jgi:hypothetical protein
VPMDPRDASLRGRIGAHTTHGRHDSRELTRPAREAFGRRWEALADPDGILDDDERRRRADHLRRAHFARLARLSAIARSKNAARRRSSRASKKAARSGKSETAQDDRDRGADPASLS